MNVLITGINGGLGQLTRQILSTETSWNIIGISRTHIHWSNRQIEHTSGSWLDKLDTVGFKPQVIINTAAETDLDKCEIHREVAWDANTTRVENLIEYCMRDNIKLLQISSDNVFDGLTGPYIEEDVPAPINYYGRTKLAAENLCKGKALNHAIIRTMWLYGSRSSNRKSFVDWIVESLTAKRQSKIAMDEIGSPTHYVDVAYGILKIIEKDARGIFNIAGPEVMSRSEMAQIVASFYRLPADCLEEVLSADLGRIARRPLKSGLITLKAETMLGLRTASLASGLAWDHIQQHRNIPETKA